MGVEIRLYHLSGMSLVNTMIGVANLLIYGEVIDLTQKTVTLEYRDGPSIANDLRALKTRIHFIGGFKES